jgi:hypothetical protein
MKFQVSGFLTTNDHVELTYVRIGMVFNHDHLITFIATKSTTTVTAIKRTAFQSDPVLINSLPILQSGIAYNDLTHALNTILDGIHTTTILPSHSTDSSPILEPQPGTSSTPKRNKPPRSSIHPHQIQSYQVFKAIEQRDIMFLMEVRDHQFDLLVRSHGGTIPLIHAMRAGPHRLFFLRILICD